MSDIFQKKIDELFRDMSNVFSIADDIFIAGLDELDRDLDMTLDKVLSICRQANLKCDEDGCLFICTSIPFMGEVIS